MWKLVILKKENSLDNEIIKEEMNKLFDKFKMKFSVESEFIKNDISKIKYAKPQTNIKYFKYYDLIDLKEYLKELPNKISSLIEIKKDEKGNIGIYAKKKLSKGTFLIDIIGFIGYTFINLKEKKKDKAKKILIYKVNDKNHYRYMHLTKIGNLGSLICILSNSRNSNLEIINYLDFDLTVKVGLITSKNILKGENLICDISKIEK